MPVITWTPGKIERFKIAYRAAVESKADTFSFDGNLFVVSYAKYLIEYLKSRRLEYLKSRRLT